jgi:hypothetical protein
MTGRFRYYPLPRVLPAGQELVVNMEKRVMTLVQHTDEGTEFLEQESFTETEYALALDLLEAFPEYCPLEVLLSTVSNRSVETCREQWIRALDEGASDQIVRPMRNHLSRTRVKLHLFNIDVNSIVETGYMLTPLVALRKVRRDAGSARYQEVS